MLTITGLMLGWYFIQNIMMPGPAPLPSFVVAAIAVAMISVGARYIIKSPTKKKKKPEEGSPQ